MDKDAAKILQNGISIKEDICQRSKILLWGCWSMGISKINKDIGSMSTMFYKWKTAWTD